MGGPFIYLLNGGSAELVDSILEGGTGLHDGAVLLWGRGVLVATRTVFRDNSGTWSEKGGGAIECTDGCDVTIDDSTFLRNMHPGEGGAIRGFTGSSAPSSVVVRNTLFEGNSAGEGGAINHDVTTAQAGGHSFVVDGCTFRGNVASAGGGAIHLTSVDTTIRGCTFKNNTVGTGADATQGGGAVYIMSGVSDAAITTQTITGSTFEGNSVLPGHTGSGGALVVDALSGTLNVTDSTFRRNQAGGKGGDGGAVAVSSATGPVYFSGATVIHENMAPRGSGGGMALSGLTGGVDISGAVEISSNEATVDGGGVVASGSLPRFRMNGTTVRNNTVRTRLAVETGWKIRMWSSASGHPRTCALPTADFVAHTQAERTTSAPKIQQYNGDINYNVGTNGMYCYTIAPFGKNLPHWGFSTRVGSTEWPEEEYGCLDLDFDNDQNEQTSWNDDSDAMSAAEFTALYVPSQTGTYQFLMYGRKSRVSVSIDGAVILSSDRCE